MRKARRNRRNRGFTLLEVLIVVGILAMLAAFVVPNLIRGRDKANIDLTQAKVDTSGPVASALRLYNLHMGEYPEELKDLTEQPDDSEDKWHGPYIDNPQELVDAWGEELIYEKDGEFNGEGKFDLYSKGPDEEEGSDDDIGNWKKE